MLVGKGVMVCNAQPWRIVLAGGGIVVLLGLFWVSSTYVYCYLVQEFFFYENDEDSAHFERVGGGKLLLESDAPPYFSRPMNRTEGTWQWSWQ